MILVGDIGGTHARLAFFEKGLIYEKATFKSQSYLGLEPIVQEYLSSKGKKIDKASFALAGIVQKGVCKTTNLPWVVDAAKLTQALEIPSVHLLNDLESSAYGVLHLPKEEKFLLQKGDSLGSGNRALIAAGTGLGEAGIYWDGKRYLPFAGEGGHSDFAPRNQLETELLLYAKEKFGHVSYERIVSGPGLHLIYRFLIETGKEKPANQLAKLSETPSTISELGCSGKDPACQRAVEWFISLYGSEAGNLALKMLSSGGFYIGGGIAPHLIELFQRGLFIDSFVDKGRFRTFLEKIPVWVVLNENTALLGAGLYAEQYGS